MTRSESETDEPAPRSVDPAAGGDGRTGSRRSARGLRNLAASLPRITRKALGKGGYAEGGLIADWPSIVGAELAARCRPTKLAFARAEGRRAGTLTLRVEAGHALEIQHRLPLLIERINGHFGYRVVERVKLQQSSLPAPRAPEAPAETPLGAAAAAALAGKVAEVEDPDLQEALERLGRAVYQRPDR